MKVLICLLTLLAGPAVALASSGSDAGTLVDLTQTVWGYLGVLLFVGAYALVPFENTIHLRKSKPVLMAAGIIWVLVAIAYIR